MKRIYIPTNKPEDWKILLADPDKHWKTGYSARTLANSWEKSNGLPSEVKRVLEAIPAFSDIEVLIAIPEHKVPLPGGGADSQNDIWLLSRNNSNLISITVEGKVSESFGPTLKEWSTDMSKGKAKRLNFLSSALGLNLPLQHPEKIRYQLLHRTVSAIIEAERFFADYAIMLVHSFSPNNERFSDFQYLVSLFDKDVVPDQVVSVGKRSGKELYLGWVRGNQEHLNY